MFVWKKLITAAALALASVHASAIPTLAFSTPSVTNGNSVDVGVVVSGIDDLFAYQFSIGFDPRLLVAVSASTGPFLGTAGTVFDDAGMLDNEAGTIRFVFAALLGDVPGANGSGTLFSVHFDTLGSGTALFSFSDLLFLDSTGADIGIVATNGALAILPVMVPPGTDMPEPASALLLGAGAAAFLGRRRAAAMKLAA